jgi:16S rRNA (cytidine1402-2'-O)-methyltransferase
VLFEAPHRIAALLADLARLAPSVRVAACREMTKLHEEVVIGTPAEVAASLHEQRGELTLVISAIPAASEKAAFDADAMVAAARGAGLLPRTIVELLRAAGLPRRDAYRMVQAASVSRD